MYDNELIWKKTETLSERYDDKNERQYDASGDFYKVNNINSDEKWKKILESKMRQDVIRVIDLRDTMFMDFWKEAMANYALDTKERSAFLKSQWLSFRTNECQPIIRTYVDRLYSAIIRANFTTKVYPETAKPEAARRIQNALSACWYRAKVKKSLADQLFDTILFGLWFSRTGFRMTKEVIDQIQDIAINKEYVDEEWNKVERFVELKGKFAEFNWVSLFNLYGEPSIDFYKQRRLIYRKILPFSDIKERLNGMVQFTDDMQAIILEHPQPFSTKNFDLIRLIKYYRNSSLSKMPTATDKNVEDNRNIDEFFEVKNDDGHCEYCEMWMKDNLVISVNGYVVFDGVNPRWDGTHPFKVTQFTRSPGVWIADGAGTLLAGAQKLYNSLYNMTFDLSKLHAGPMFVLKPGQQIRGNKDGKLVWDPFSFVQVEWGDTEIKALQFPEINPSTTRVMSDILEMANFMIAPSTYNATEWVSRSATDAQFKYEWLKDSIINVMESVNEMLALTYQDWIQNMRVHMPEKFNFYYPEGDKSKWLKKGTLYRSDLEAEYSYEIDSESIREMNKIVERQQFLELLKVINLVGKDPTSGKWLINMTKLAEVALDLFNQDLWLLLDDKEYLKQLVDAEKLKLDLQDAVRALYKDRPEGNREEQPQQPLAPQEWWQQQFQQQPQQQKPALDMQSFLKRTME